MRTLCLWMALVAWAAGAGPQSVMTSPHKLAWGWGCGGNCAVNFSGESETTLSTGAARVQFSDQGTLTRRQSDPAGLTTTTTRWRYSFRSTGTTGSERREYTLHTDVSECSRTEEIAAEGKPTTKTTTSCPGPPKRWKLACERREMQVKGQPRPAWVCSPAPPMDPFGTDFPWVFGIDAPITTVVSGEPRPHTSYE